MKLHGDRRREFLICGTVGKRRRGPRTACACLTACCTGRKGRGSGMCGTEQEQLTLTSVTARQASEYHALSSLLAEKRSCVVLLTRWPCGTLALSPSVRHACQATNSGLHKPHIGKPSDHPIRWESKHSHLGNRLLSSTCSRSFNRSHRPTQQPVSDKNPNGNTHPLSCPPTMIPIYS